MLLVSSATLTAAAETMRKAGDDLREVRGEGVYVSAAQLEEAARLLREAEPSICNGLRQERPGFIDGEEQDVEDVLVFRLGILPTETYLIPREGSARRWMAPHEREAEALPDHAIGLEERG